MRLIYRPEDGPRQEWSLRLTQLLSPEAEALEEAGGRTWRSFEEFAELVDEGVVKARRALLWILLRRQNPQLQFADLVVKVDEIDLDFDDDQVAELRRRAVDQTLTGAERDRARQMLEATDRPLEPVAEAEPGKDEPGGSPTGSP